MQIKIFENEEFGRIRTVMIDNEPWFVGKDVAQILEYRETAKAIRTHVDAEDKGVSVLELLTNLCFQERNSTS